MSTALLFWILMLFAFLFGAWSTWPAPGTPGGFRPLGNTFLYFVLIGLLGWKVFGAALHS